MHALIMCCQNTTKHKPCLLTSRFKRHLKTFYVSVAESKASTPAGNPHGGGASKSERKQRIHGEDKLTDAVRDDSSLMSLRTACVLGGGGGGC